VRDYGTDELGTVARALDDSVRELASRLAELGQDRARMEAVLTGMAEGVLAVNGQGRVELANNAVRRMLAQDDSPVGRHYLEAIRHPGVTRLLTAALEGQESEGLELTPARNPERRVVARAAPVVGPGGKGAMLVLHDITDLRLADQVRRDFVANVSHELRTPLTAIRGYVEALRDDPGSASEQQRFLEIIERHANRMERLVKDLLRLASLEGRQEPVERSRCDVGALFGTVAGDLAAPIRAKDQRVEIHVEPSAAALNTDAAKLQDALRNLIENAVNYAPAGSTIRLEARVSSNGRVALTVADGGPGIPEADLTRVFERFYRVDKARSRESGGTGLGLSIVRHLVELLGGDVRAANRLEGGAIFTVTLPPEALQV
jgi:two-component system phosphate regulon sensor histidine kinase PhoR